jgi:CheY-like chemotaxis protein
MGALPQIKKVLIADDDSSIRALIRTCIAEWKAEVIEAEDGRQALDLAQSELPDLILLDQLMPQLLGLEVAAELRKDVRLQNSTIVMITSEPEPTPTPRTLMFRVYDGWISKPFPAATLKDRLMLYVMNMQRP